MMPPRTRGGEHDDVAVQSMGNGHGHGPGHSNTVDDHSLVDNPFEEVAQRTWLKATTRKTKIKVKQDVVKNELWDVLAQRDFQYSDLLDLDNLQLLEGYLWPGYSEDATDHHVSLVAMIANVRSREHLSLWSIFEDNPLNFSDLFRRILSMTLDISSLSINLRTHLLTFVTNAFQSLDSGIVRKECAPLVSIALWHNIRSDQKRDSKLDQTVQLRKAWRVSAKRYEAADDATQPRLRFERQWLYSMILDFFNQLYNPKSKSDNVLYCERFLEFLCDLQSQLPTRRYLNTLLHDLNFLSVIRLSPLFAKDENDLIRDLYSLLRHYTFFTIDDHSGTQYTLEQAYGQHCERLASLQRVALRSFKDKLTILALSNYGSLEKRVELEGHLTVLTDAELLELCSLLGFRTSYPKSAGIAVDKKFCLEIVLAHFEKRKTFQETAKELSILPTESTLYEPMLLRNETYNGSQPLALPKLNLQYLTVGDFLWRSFILHRCEAFFEIRKDLEDTLKRLRPRSGRNGETVFDGFSKMALLISKPSVLEVVPALVGDEKPSVVKAEVALDVNGLADNIRREWETLRPDDVIFLLAVEAPNNSRIFGNGATNSSNASELGIRSIRAAEVTQMLDEQGKPLREGANNSRARLRRLHVKLDAASYKDDMQSIEEGKSNVYDSVNVIVRRRGRENNFKPILESIQSLTLSDVPIAPWLHEVFLGYGDPAAATYPRLSKQIKKIDYRDTFLNWEHLQASLADKKIESNGETTPPYVLETILTSAPAASARPAKKRRRDEVDTNADSIPMQTIKVSTYKPPKMGPYPMDEPKLNHVQFTPTQIEAIISGTQPGLTVIVGPPGTGKTDVATQIINNIYHNFPEQRTLLIAHSNQALNQLFQKIVALDIDERHLLRLGHGESELDTDVNFSKYGRVDSFLANRDRYLLEVDRLASNLKAPGAHGSSAETAGYFNSVYVEPAWTRFQDAVKENDSVEAILQAFPFHEYFSNAPQPVFPPAADTETVLSIANGCYHHIIKIFTELADVRPFEILPRERDKANYLLTSEARVIAMTSTHAAMRRRQIAGLGFHYDNVIMEEAAQITEIENFIPLALQNKPSADKRQGGLQRVVLCGDHLQNSPVVQNLAFRQYANLEQSLFSRLVRLGVPTITLNAQGRARPSIATLYSWRYKMLSNLPLVTHATSSCLPEFATANAGFKYDYQFIDVPDYKGKGESEPTPHFIQNLGEAEYAVALFMYMRLLGYPASKITILATYAGQRTLVKDVLEHRCRKNPLFGMPGAVSTVDRYQGEQNDYVILSLTRSTRIGYLRDVRRLTVALSRARLGLYILGRRSIFETCHELAPAFEVLLRRPDKLTLMTGELWPTKRSAVDTVPDEGAEADSKKKPAKASKGGKKKKGKKEVEEIVEESMEAAGPPSQEAVMEGVEHLGQYVFEMTNARVEMLKVERGIVGGVPSIEDGGDTPGPGRDGQAGYDDEEEEQIE